METLFDRKINFQGVGLKKVGQMKHIVRQLYFNGPMSNAELSRNLNLSTPKINSLLRDLIGQKLVMELGQGYSSGGRRPVIYGLIKDSFYVVGITVNIYFSIISVFNAHNQEITGPHTVPVSMQKDFNIFSRIHHCLQEIMEKVNIPAEKVIAAGIELPGLVDREKYINKTYFPEIENLHHKIGDIFGIPVFIDNDARMRTFAEQQFGLAKGKQNVLMVHMDWGVGLGLILNGQLYTGKSGFSGEFGHIPLSENGMLCQCGKLGCLETLASATAITLQAREGIEKGNSSLLPALVNNELEKIETNTVIQAACLGDQFSISLLSNVGFWLGKGIAHLIQIFNPELIIVGGKLAEASQFILAPIRQAIYTYSNQDISNDTEIMFSVLGVKAGTIGAAAFAVEKLSGS